MLARAHFALVLAAILVAVTVTERRTPAQRAERVGSLG